MHTRPPVAHVVLFYSPMYGVKVVLGTHPIPEKYLELHTELGTWDAPQWDDMLAPTMADQKTRKAYN